MPKDLGCYGLIFLPQGASLALYLFILFFNISETWSLQVLFIVLQTVLDTLEVKILSVTPGFHELHGPLVFAFSSLCHWAAAQHPDLMPWNGWPHPPQRVLEDFWPYRFSESVICELLIYLF